MIDTKFRAASAIPVTGNSRTGNAFLEQDVKKSGEELV